MKIRQYKKFQISYDKKKKMFVAKRGKKFIEAKDENLLESAIDSWEEQQEKEKKEKEHEKTKKMLGNTKFKVDARDFRYFCYCINGFTNEALIQYEDESFYALVFDPAYCVLIEMRIPVECKKKLKHFKFAINIDNLSTIIRGTVKKGKTTITFDFDNLMLKLNDGFGMFSIPMVELEEEFRKPPELKFTNEFEIKATQFQYYMKCADKIGESVAFLVKDKKLNFIVKNDDEKHTYISPSIPQKGKDCRGKYSIEYLRQLKFQGKLLFEFSKDYPLRVTDEKGNTMTLAPRIEV